MKILVDARPLFIPRPGGVTRVTLPLVRALCEAMPEHEFIFASTGSTRPTLPFTLPANARHIHKRLPNKLVSAGTASDARSFDAWFPKTDAIFFPNIGHIGKPRVPYTLLIHDLSFLVEPAWFPPRGRIWHRITHAQRLIREATHLFTVSAWTKRDLVAYLKIPADRITILPLGLPSLPATRYPLPASLEPPFLLALGGNDARKNSGCAIAAFHALKEDPTFENVRLVLVGKPNIPSSALKDVTVLDRPNDRALAALYKNAAAFLYPSWYEGFGLPLHEAAQFHTPCLASTASALPETAPKGTQFAPPAKPHLWAAAIKEILKEPTRFRTETELGGWEEAGGMVGTWYRTWYQNRDAQT